jgi:predicted NBD/HSP70 family sugar kinase
MDQYLVIDVGGSHIKYALMTPESILDKGEVETPMEGLDQFLNTLEALYKKYEDKVKGIALSVPGRIDIHKGIMHTGGYLRYIEDFPLIETLGQRCPVKISIENDGKCAALAELWKGSLVGIEHGLVIVLGTAIGGGVIIDGKLLRGPRFAAGELSSLPISLVNVDNTVPFSWAHLCGTMGLTEVYEDQNGLPEHSINGKRFFELVNTGDDHALSILSQFSKSLAIGIFGIQAILDTQVIAIGGGISAQPILLESLQKALDNVFELYPGMPIGKPKLVRCAFANDSNLYGALYHHLYE